MFQLMLTVSVHRRASSQQKKMTATMAVVASEMITVVVHLIIKSAI
jgi:hypothetical protein